MKATGLAARVMYAMLMLPLSFVAAVYGTSYALPIFAAWFGFSAPPAQSEEMFQLGLTVGAIVAVPAFLCALTLPWRRRRHRSGRKWRLAIAAVIVVLASLEFADNVHNWRYDLIFALWLSYTLALTFVRYGVIDRERTRRIATEPDED